MNNLDQEPLATLETRRNAALNHCNKLVLILVDATNALEQASQDQTAIPEALATAISASVKANRDYEAAWAEYEAI